MFSVKRVVLVAAALCATMASAETKPEWADRGVFAVNRLEAHAFAHRFPSKEAARPEPDWKMPYHQDRYKMLNGDWKFNWSLPKAFLAISVAFLLCSTTMAWISQW